MRTVLPLRARLVPEHAKRVFQGVIYDVYHWEQRRFDGSCATFEMLKRPDTIKILAVHDDKIVALIDEQPGRAPVFTLPGGRHDNPTETELDCAKRELAEETGMYFKTWKLIEVFQSTTKIEHFVYLFLATDFKRQETPQPEPGEKVEVRKVTITEGQRLSKEVPSGYWPYELLRRNDTIEKILQLPEYQGQKVQY